MRPKSYCFIKGRADQLTTDRITTPLLTFRVGSASRTLSMEEIAALRGALAHFPIVQTGNLLFLSTKNIQRGDCSFSVPYVFKD